MLLYSDFKISNCSKFSKDGHLPQFYSMSVIFSLILRAFSLPSFIDTCRILYLIKSRNTLLSLISLNSANQVGMLSSNSVTKLKSSTKLAINFQKEGPCFCLSILLKWRTITEWSELIDEIMSDLSISS